MNKYESILKVLEEKRRQRSSLKEDIDQNNLILRRYKPSQKDSFLIGIFTFLSVAFGFVLSMTAIFSFLGETTEILFSPIIQFIGICFLFTLVAAISIRTETPKKDSNYQAALVGLEENERALATIKEEIAAIEPKLCSAYAKLHPTIRRAEVQPPSHSNSGYSHINSISWNQDGDYPYQDWENDPDIVGYSEDNGSDGLPLP